MAYNRPTLFDKVAEKNVIFCIDSSGSMYCRLQIVKDNLKEVLAKLSLAGDRRFNMVDFNTTVTQWSDEMVKCVPETVKVANDWINLIDAKTGTDTESALLAAYNDKECDAVYLVTDGLPDTKPSDILDRVAYVCNGRPCHCIYLTGATVDKEATNFLQDLATETFGSFTIVTVTSHGSIERVAQVYKASHSAVGVIRTVDKNIYPGNHKQCSVTNTLDNLPVATAVVKEYPTYPNPYCVPVVPPGGTIPAVTPIIGPHPGVACPILPGPRVYATENGQALRVPYFNYAWSQWYQPYLWARYRTARSWLKLSDDLDGAISGITKSPAAGALLIDQTVLARRSEDGLYYKGRVKSQIATDRFLVEFEPCEKGKYQETTYQEIFVFDVVQMIDAARHSVCKGDKVLAPTDSDATIYAPGTVIDGQEGRDTCRDMKYQEIVVMLSTGKTVSVKNGKALWIDQLLYDRASFELKLPKKVRQNIIETIAKYPEDNLPGYPVSGSKRDPEEWELPRKFHVTGDEATYDPFNGLQIHKEQFENYNGYLKDHSQRSSTTRSKVESFVPGTSKTEEELERKVFHQIEAHQREHGEYTDIYERRSRSRERRSHSPRTEIRSDNLTAVDHDIELLESELKYKMKLREKALDLKRSEIDAEIEDKIRARDRLIEDRKLVLRSPRESRLSQSRDRLVHTSEGYYTPRDSYHRMRSRSRSLSPPRSPRLCDEITRSRSHTRHSPRDGYSNKRSRSRSYSPDVIHRARSHSRSHSLSPRRRKSVDFDSSLNSIHKYRYYDEQPYDEYWLDEYGNYRNFGTNTPHLRNGRVVKPKKNEQKPPWKYWKGAPVPETTGPPLSTFEPFNQTAVAEPLELRDVHIRNSGVIDFGSSQFQHVVPNGRTNYERFVRSEPDPTKSVRFQDKPNSSVSRGSNIVNRDGPSEKLLSRRRTEVQRKMTDPKNYYINGDCVGDQMQDFHRERVVAQMHREKQRPGTRTYTNQMKAMGAKPTAQPNSTMDSGYTSNTSGTFIRNKTDTYKQELSTKNAYMNGQGTDQGKIASMAARRQAREHLQSAKVQQVENERARSAELKRQRASIRDEQHTTKLMADYNRQRQTLTA